MDSAPISDRIVNDLFHLLYKQTSNLFVQVLVRIERETKIKREFLFSGSMAVMAIYLVFGHFAQLLCNLIGFAYPAYCSYKAICTPEKSDDTEWLIYWTVFASFSLIDFGSEKILGWFPFYWLVKCCFLLYLYLPQCKGAQVIYRLWLEPKFQFYEGKLHDILNGNDKTQPTITDDSKERKEEKNQIEFDLA